ncbi:1158_t:CDS:2 [Entrophospora sp. SA101]|nr:1158_t:CDS:2 [Entrophospora sp. SA101]
MSSLLLLGTSFSNETIGIVVGIWNIFKGVVAVGGLYGGITGKQRFVRIFGWVLGLTIVIYLGLVILSSVIHFQNQSSMVDACVHKAQVNNASGLKWDPKENWSKPFKKRQDPKKCTQAIKLYLVFLLSFYFVSIVSSYSSELRRQLKHNRLKDDDDFGERGGTLDRLSMSSTSDKHPARGISHDNV